MGNQIPKGNGTPKGKADRYSTSDLVFAAFLVHRGHGVVEMTGTSKDLVWIEFDQTEVDMHALRNAFLKSTERTMVLTYTDLMRAAKEFVHNSRRERD